MFSLLLLCGYTSNVSTFVHSVLTFEGLLEIYEQYYNNYVTNWQHVKNGSCA